jgi:hypothetical protein
MTNYHRKKVNVNPMHFIDIRLSEEYSEMDDGEKLYYKKDSINIHDLLNVIKNANIPESEYKNISISVTYYDYGRDAYLGLVYKKPKTEKEIEEETIKQQKEIENYRKDVEKRKIEKEEKRKKKQEIINQLTEEQKKALNIK